MNAGDWGVKFVKAGQPDLHYTGKSGAEYVSLRMSDATWYSQEEAHSQADALNAKDGMLGFSAVIFARHNRRKSDPDYHEGKLLELLDA